MLGEELASQERLTEWLVGGGGVTPLPETFNVPAAVELIMALIEPLADPAPVGANVTVPLTLWFGFSVKGMVTPLMENAAPFTVNCETVKLDPPVLDMEMVSALLLPTFTFPKLRLDEAN